MLTYQDLKQRLQAYIHEEKHPDFLSEAQRLLEDEKELALRFSSHMEFGTGGLRGIIGAGSSYMNPLNVRRATQGLAEYIIQQGMPRKAVISFDSRRYSEVFALEAALVFCGNNFEVFLYRQARSTPQLSWTIRHLNASTGIMITASHNPPDYNGYKAYWNTGGQLIPPHDEAVVRQIDLVKTISSMEKQEALNKALLHEIGDEWDELFINAFRQTASPHLVNLSLEDPGFKVAYTPLHGVGGLIIEKIFADTRVKIIQVPEQKDPDGTFPTVDYPNPEDPKALKKVLALAEEHGATLALATDPDADRLGVGIYEDGKWFIPNGNQIAVLMLEYLLRQKHLDGKESYIVTSIVSTPLVHVMAEKNHCQIFETLTGFKWIGNRIEHMNLEGKYPFLFAFEESFGFLPADHVRDKDGLSSARLFVELMLYLRKEKLRVQDFFKEIYEKYGFYTETLISHTFTGFHPQEKMNAIVENLRQEAPKEFASIPISLIKDYKTLTQKKAQGFSESFSFEARSNVLQFYLGTHSLMAVRPSGTEPKIKFYISSWSSYEERHQAEEHLDRIKKAIQTLLEGH